MSFEIDREELDKANTSGARWDRPLAKGVYPAECVFGDDHLSNEGKKGMKFTYSIDAPQAAAPQGPVKLDYYVSSAWGAKNFLEANSPEALNSTGKIAINAPDFVGSECRVKITHEKYNGEMRPKIAMLMPLEDSAPAATQAAPAKRADAVPANAGPAPADDGDVPF